MVSRPSTRNKASLKDWAQYAYLQVLFYFLLPAATGCHLCPENGSVCCAYSSNLRFLSHRELCAFPWRTAAALCSVCTTWSFRTCPASVFLLSIGEVPREKPVRGYEFPLCLKLLGVLPSYTSYIQPLAIC